METFSYFFDEQFANCLEKFLTWVDKVGTAILVREVIPDGHLSHVGFRI